MRQSPSLRRFSLIIHLIGLLSFTATFAWLPNITNPVHKGFGGPYQFLTFIALTLSTITFATGLLADISGSKKLFGLKNSLSICATSLDVLVSAMYWTLHTVDKKLVVPPGHEVPPIPDLGFHAVPALMLTVDMMLLSPPWTIKSYNAMVLASIFIMSYWAWIEYCRSINGWYPYPLLSLLSAWQKMLLCGVTAALMSSTMMVLKWGHKRVNTRLPESYGNGTRISRRKN